ncbi:hypothetical protein [Streptomyces sp. NPDC046759]|uniref:ABC transporter substrate-binding protein n=1 Tax=Streptomyces sp. NPDC046759 TaxID=3155019 RepID=UPI00340342E6
MTPDGQDAWPNFEHIRSQQQFREALGKLQKRQGVTQKAVAEASDDGSGRLTTTTINATLRRDALPVRSFVIKYLLGCGVSEVERQRWLRCWERLLDEAAPAADPPPEDAVPVEPAAAGAPGGPEQAGPAEPTPEEVASSDDPPLLPVKRGRWRLPTGRSRLRVGVVACAVAAALTVGVGTWHHHQQEVHDQRIHDQQVQERERERERFKQHHCGTFNPDLVTQAGGECTGITDGSDDSAVFGKDLKPVMTAIAAENRNVVKSGDYVTVAFLTALTSKSANNLTVGQYVAELEGAYTALEEENRKNSRPKIRLLVANMGSAEAQWAQAVGRLTALKKDSRLVAVTGLGLSQQESVDAARALSKADLPMVGDLITADGFDATGAVDGKGAINGLARVALTNSDQLTAVSKELGPAQRTAALVSTTVTPNGTKDLYTESLNHGFHTVEGLKKYLDNTSDFTFDPRGGPGAILPTISQNLCNTGKTVDTVYYAARVKYLPDFLDALASRSCHAQPITVITGSDAASLDPNTPALHKHDAPISVLYANFPSRAQFRSPDNPDHDLYEAFAKDFTAPHHGQQFAADHLTSSYWALVAHDAVLTVATALHNAAANSDSTTSLPNRYAVRNELFALRNGAIAGATGRFGIDSNGNRTHTSTITTVHQLGHALPR